uniref:Uncharacterized protein n=3 Tax=Oryza TaxID=4527 RepID=A0A0E0PZG3_ORYRU
MRLARGNHVLICTKEDESGEGAERQSLQPFLLELESRFAPNDRIQRECKFEVFSAGYGDGDDQLTTCTKLALDHIDIDLENVQGFDSNAFTMKLFDDNDDLIYFHVVFTGETPGRRGGGGKRYSFAEIVGKDKPEEVRMWKEMDEESENCTVENCIFCTGMWHPLSGGFCGYKRKKKNRR